MNRRTAWPWPVREIAQLNMDLATRTESEASALEETAAAMEELGLYGGHNAEHAQSAENLPAKRSAWSPRW